MAAEESFAANVCALTSGYRHLDSARLYGSEGPCGESIRQSAIPRSEIFVTSKVSQGGYAETRAAVADSLKDSGLEYLDLYLVHSPYGGPEARKGAWRALVEAQKEGKVRSIGVSNYGVQHLEETENYIKELEKELGKGNAGVISVGQWELHPWLPRKDIVAWCQERNIVIEAYCPLIRGKRFDEPVLQPLINKYNKSAAQVLLRWSLQKVGLHNPVLLSHFTGGGGWI
jgi:diketogulonate reductase-like aldo/keto reductase